MKTPITRSIVLAAGKSFSLDIIAEVVYIKSCTVASFSLAFDNEPFELTYAGEKLTSKKPFSKIRFYDSGGAGCTVVVRVGNVDVSSSSSAILATTESLLTGLTTILDVPDNPTAIPEQDTLSGGAVHLVTASARIRKVEIQADYDNAEAIYVGFTTGVTSANAAIHLQPGQSFPFDGNIDIWVGAANDTDKVRGYYVENA